MDALRRFGISAAPAWVAVLAEQDGAARAAAIGARARTGPGAAPLLIDAFRNPDKNIQHGAVRAFGAMEVASEVVPALVAALRDDDPQVRRSATEALATLGTAATGAVGELASRLGEDGDPDVQVGAAETLGSLGRAAAAAAPTLAAALLKPRLRVKAAAARALGEIGPEAIGAVPALAEALARPEPAVLAAALSAAIGIGTGGTPALVVALANGWSAAVRRDAAEALGTLGAVAGANMAKALIVALDDLDDSVRHAAAALQRLDADGVTAAAGALASPKARVRKAAAEVLAGCGRRPQRRRRGGRGRRRESPAGHRRRGCSGARRGPGPRLAARRPECH